MNQIVQVTHKSQSWNHHMIHCFKQGRNQCSKCINATFDPNSMYLWPMSMYGKSKNKLRIEYIYLLSWLYSRNVLVWIKSQLRMDWEAVYHINFACLIWAKTKYSWKNHFFPLSLSFRVQSCHHQMQDSYAMYAVFILWLNGLQEPYH